MLAMPSVEKGPETSDTGAPAISAETKRGHSCETRRAPRTLTAVTAQHAQMEGLGDSLGPAHGRDGVSQGLRVLSPRGGGDCAGRIEV